MSEEATQPAESETPEQEAPAPGPVPALELLPTGPVNPADGYSLQQEVEDLRLKINELQSTIQQLYSQLETERHRTDAARQLAYRQVNELVESAASTAILMQKIGQVNG